MSKGRFETESLRERLARYERLRDQAQSDLTRFNAEIMAIQRRLRRREKAS